MEINLGKFECCSRWRLQVYLLQDPSFVKFVETNTNETTVSIRWEAFKADIRGEMISYKRSKPSAIIKSYIH